ncbi:DUF4091 domain-containing protein [Aestuariimicrobium ganziense]|uniref:DUF4091 domain-containing protein n=1 Tax=Aestuariimicrobium ganziense TaxID=2773677 RepID=UPI0019421E5C|nr:DUF4091 domain-containing protein [Aestuariimicrobium ganziense]
MTQPWRFLLCDDLEKVRPHLDPRPMDEDVPLTAFLGERIGLQVVVGTPEGYAWWPAPEVRVTATCAGAEVVAHLVEQVPTQLPAFPGHDENYFDDVPGLYPDLLVPIDLAEPVRLATLGWNAIWLDITPTSADAGPVSISASVTATNWDGTEAEPETFTAEVPLEVTPEAAPATRLTHLAWLHADGLAHHHGYDVWSDEHFAACANHVRAAVEMGVTAVLTPIWTPPLDTAVGHDRLNVQLLDIWHDDEGYHFGTEKLDRWLGILREAGARQVEVPHLFTQWGARFAPQVWVTTPDGPEKRFGWHVGAMDDSYQTYLAELIPFLRSHLASEAWGGEVIWHISDEPTEAHIETYTAARQSVRGLLEGEMIVDALSSPDFVTVVDHPIVATDHVHAFHERGLEVPMVYYCVSQNRAVSNRFIAQYSVGARHLSGQMFVQQATTFLHWGFNFYLQQYGLGPIDPFRDTSAGGRFPSGDPFTVYPGTDGACWPSLRHRVLSEMTNDLRVMHWAADLIGRDAVTEIVDPDDAYSGARGYEATWPSASEWKRRRLALDRAVREALAQ